MEHQPDERSGAARTRVGPELAQEREAQGVALADIALRTRVPLRTLQALEAGSTEGMPALTYTAGFVRSYADALGLDGGDYARRFRAEMGRAPQPTLPDAFELADPARVPTRLLAIVALLIAVAIAGGYAIWRGDGLFGGGATDRARLAAGTDGSAPLPPPNAVAPAVTPAPAPAAQPTGPVTIAATEPAWVKVYERDGPTLLMKILDAGERYEVPATAVDPLIRTSRPQSLTITIGATAIPPLAAPDVLVKDRSLRREALLTAPLPIAPLPIAPLRPEPAATTTP